MSGRTYKGDAGLTGVSADASVRPPLKLLWSYRLDGDASGDAGAGVTVAGGKVFVNVHNTRSIVALDAHTGQFAWEYADSAVGYKTVPSLRDGRLILWERYFKNHRGPGPRRRDRQAALAAPLEERTIDRRTAPACRWSTARSIAAKAATSRPCWRSTPQTGKLVWRDGAGQGGRAEPSRRPAWPAARSSWARPTSFGFRAGKAARSSPWTPTAARSSGGKPGIFPYKCSVQRWPGRRLPDVRQGRPEVLPARCQDRRSPVERPGPASLHDPHHHRRPDRHRTLWRRLLQLDRRTGKERLAVRWQDHIGLLRAGGGRRFRLHRHRRGQPGRRRIDRRPSSAPMRRGKRHRAARSSPSTCGPASRSGTSAPATRSAATRPSPMAGSTSPAGMAGSTASRRPRRVSRPRPTPRINPPHRLPAGRKAAAQRRRRFPPRPGRWRAARRAAPACRASLRSCRWNRPGRSTPAAGS